MQIICYRFEKEASVFSFVGIRVKLHIDEEDVRFVDHK